MHGTPVGSSYAYQSNYKLAIECFNEALKINRNEAITHYNMGIAYSRMGDYEKAASYQKNATRIRS